VPLGRLDFRFAAEAVCSHIGKSGGIGFAEAYVALGRHSFQITVV
jgi:hypothetical protein